MITKPEFLARAANIRLALFDVDGVLTDGRLYFGPTGEELKVFHVQDGLGLKLLQNSGIQVGIISSRNSKIVSQRLQELGVEHIYQGQENKQSAFADLLKKLQLSTDQVSYVGDDLPDLPLIQQAGLGICVANANPILPQYADWQTQAKGGKGAVREICDAILEAQGLLQQAYQAFLVQT